MGRGQNQTGGTEGQLKKCQRNRVGEGGGSLGECKVVAVLATGPLIKMHKLSRQRDDDAKSSMRSLPTVCQVLPHATVERHSDSGYTLDRGRQEEGGAALDFTLYAKHF